MKNNWQYLQRSQVDSVKWDECIKRAVNGRVYGLSGYLNHTSKDWDALVYGDYELVMPLPWKKKFGIRYVFAPPFTQHLGLFGEKLNTGICAEAVRLASSAFRWIDYNINDSIENTAGKSTLLTNYILDLNGSYESIREGYTSQCVVNIQKSIRRGCTFEKGVPVSEIIRLFRDSYGSMHSTNDNEYHRFEELMNNPGQFKVHALGVRDQQTRELLFGALLLEFQDRLYYALGAPTEKGRNARATYFFIDQVIQRYAESKRIFDFEGSDLPNVAEFYQRFGPKREYYRHLRINNLPWFARMIKS